MRVIKNAPNSYELILPWKNYPPKNSLSVTAAKNEIFFPNFF